MQESIRTGGDKQFRLSNPLLDLAVAGLEAQLKAWQAYQVPRFEGAVECKCPRRVFDCLLVITV